MTDENLEKRIADLEKAVFMLADALTDAIEELQGLGQPVHDSDALQVYEQFRKKTEADHA